MDFDDDDGQSDFVSNLLEGGYLQGAEIGAAKAFLKGGEDDLSAAQKPVFHNFVIRKHDPGACKRCRNGIAWADKYDAMHNGGFCSYCANLIHKSNRED